MNSMNELAKQIIITKLNELIDKDIFITDLNGIIYNDIVNAGSVFNDVIKSLDYITSNINDARDFAAEYCVYLDSSNLANPFTEPELFTVQWLVYSIDNLIYANDSLNESIDPNSHIKITTELISEFANL